MSLRQATRWKDSHWNPEGVLIGASGVTPELERELRLDRATPAEVLAVQGWAGNNVTDEGEQWILEAAFHDAPGASFTGFELLLATNASLLEATVFATVTELADGNGYAAKAVSRAQSAGNWSTVTGTTPSSITTPDTGNHSWTASAAWSTVEYACIVTLATAQKLIAFNALNAGNGRTLANGDTLNVTFDLQGGGS